MTRALREVREDHIGWDRQLGDAGGFRGADGRQVSDYQMLVALWQALHRSLVTVDGGCVMLTDAGRNRLKVRAS